jgi:hypothetical protein
LAASTSYHYTVGDNATGWSWVHSFNSASSVGGGITDTAAANVARMAGAEPAFVLHAGDLSYANGDQEGWDEWVRQIEPLAAKAPYMPAPGNHEYESGYGLSAFIGRFVLPHNERW